MLLLDSQERRLAIDPQQSFIVEAPAGSGKTEILTQRFLRLLGQVEAPEEIVALTFTRKAASEMKERILKALTKVEMGEKPLSVHQEQTFNYAKEALARSQLKNWQILENPSRLKVMTLDSLCQMINQAIPFNEKNIPAFAKVTERANVYYIQAAKDLLRHALDEKELQPALKSVLEHLDNRQDKFIALISQMLANRSQWMEMLYLAKEQDKASFLKMLVSIEAKEIALFSSCLEEADWQILRSLSSQMAAIENNQQSMRFVLKDWSTAELTREKIKGLAALILTSDNKLRKAFDHHVGLKKGSCDDEIYQSLKEQSKELLAYLSEKPAFLDSLVKAKQIPEPLYSEQQWACLSALFHFLPLAVAFLHLLFKDNAEVDFNAISEQALYALGTEDEPTDLALYLDHSIHHLLIDEFQDTSIQQYQLLTKLVQGFLPEQGKTLFLVGDPMQSIYRFRQAEVGLFLKAKMEGIGPIQLQYLALKTNFRSTETIINWVNTQFKSIFPVKDNMELGAIAFHSSESALKALPESYTKAVQFSDKHKEALAIAELIEQELKLYPDNKIAILVRSRNQLSELVPVLRERQISFQGVDIEPLSQLPHLRDLLMLTKALIYPANRLYWFSLLRSPYCGLSLNDLHSLANYAAKKPLLTALNEDLSLNALSEDGQLRVRFFASEMQEALATREQERLSSWLRKTFKRLKADSYLSENELGQIEQFWQLLDNFDKPEKGFDMAAFEQEFNKLFAKDFSLAQVEIMTIHKSKGLEFDSVILPGLGAKPSNKDKPLLRFLTLPTEKEDLILVSPLKAEHEENCSIYDYLGRLDDEKNAYELQRLLYVAVTRAKKRLYLFDSKTEEKKNTFRELLNEIFEGDEEEEECIEKDEINHFPIFRLPSHFYVEPSIYNKELNELPSLLTDTFPKTLGIFSHELLQWICEKHPDNIEALPWLQIKRKLSFLGLTEVKKEEAYLILRKQIDILFNSDVGNWIIKAHIDERNEYEILIEDKGQIATRIIDRTFVDKGIRWIIDFKTGKEDVLAQNKHRAQVNAYAHLLSQTFKEPICCGLYYLATGTWVEWSFEASS
ncbi:MAG: UvrD-helicase domain-containing protein [Proteobacteria bacterium]|nr:UvrD-helicase domain-containing protein [Pseudomonadota bacterium]